MSKWLTVDTPLDKDILAENKNLILLFMKGRISYGQVRFLAGGKFKFIDAVKREVVNERVTHYQYLPSPPKIKAVKAIKAVKIKNAEK